MAGNFRHSSSLLLGCVLLALLAGCSRDTIFTVRADVLSFIDPASRSGELIPLDFELELPDTDGASTAELGFPQQALRSVVRLNLDFEAVITSQATSGTEQVTVSFHLSGDGTSPFDDPAVATGTVTVGSGETSLLRLQVDVSEQVNSGTFEMLRGDDARLGVRLRYNPGVTSAGVTYRLTDLTISISARLGEGLL